MNRTFNTDNKYESNCRPVIISERYRSGNVAKAHTADADNRRLFSVLRVVIALICFVGFIGVIGGVEAGTLSVGFGIILSLFMVFIEVLCFTAKGTERR